jgi:uncharacterized protein YjbI with pentapeptide repeats
VEEENGNQIVETEGIMMKLRLIAALTLLAPLLLATPGQGANPKHIEQLLTTGECYQCNLEGADFTDAHLLGADLREANLRGANLTGANLEGADLTGANLAGANLTLALAINTELRDTNLDGVNLANAKVFDSDVYGASMAGLQLNNADIFQTGIGIGGEGNDEAVQPWPQ